MNPELYSWPTTINGRWTLRLPAYRAIRYLHEGMWERERIASMSLNLAKGDTLFDIGAESGDMSALFASWLADGGIVLVEPNPVAWPGIRLMWELNDLPRPLGCWVGFAAAEAHEIGGRENEVNQGWPACAHGDPDPACGFAHLAEQSDSIPSLTVDDLADLWRPDALTIDVEGAELEVLKGARRTLEEVRPLVWASLHPQFLRHHFDQTTADVKRYMRALDYDAVHLADDHESHTLFEPR